MPARARCGFGAYFRPGWLEDHWVAEYWDERDNRWFMVDAQLDATWRKMIADTCPGIRAEGRRSGPLPENERRSEVLAVRDCDAVVQEDVVEGLVGRVAVARADERI